MPQATGPGNTVRIKKKQVQIKTDLSRRSIQAHDKLIRPVAKRLSNSRDVAPSLSGVSSHTGEGHSSVTSKTGGEDDVFGEDGDTVSDMPSHSTAIKSKASLFGVALSLRAFQITRRLSVSHYLMPEHSSTSGASRKNSMYVPKVRYENTYRMQPKPDELFPVSQLQRIIDDVLATNLTDQSYRRFEAATLVKFLSTAINSRAKLVDAPRYKLVCNVILGQNYGQSVAMATRCLSDASCDSYAYGTFKNKHIFAVAIVHGMYAE